MTRRQPGSSPDERAYDLGWRYTRDANGFWAWELGNIRLRTSAEVLSLQRSRIKPAEIRSRV